MYRTLFVRRSRKRNRIGFLATMLLLVLLTLGTPAGLYAQDSSTAASTVVTLLPHEVLSSCSGLTISADNQGDPKCRVVLHFKTQSLPDAATIMSASLILMAQTPPDGAQTIAVTMAQGSVALMNTFPYTFGKKSLPRGTLSKDERVEWKADNTFLKNAKADQGFSLKLETSSSNLTSQWYSNDVSNSSHRPRLILEYMVDGQSALSQSDGLPSAQSPRPFLPIGARASNDTQQLYTTLPFLSVWSYTPVFYRNLVYQIIDNQGEKTLRAFSPIGNAVGTPYPLDNPGQHLLVSQSGELTIVGNHQILMVQIDSQGGLGGNTRGMGVPVGSGLNPSIPPTLGPDGSLYFVDGMEVYGLNPDLQELWKLTLSDIASSRVTVGPSGQFVYLIAKSEGLIAINAQTGEPVTIASSLAQSALSSALNLTFHAPLVVRHPDGSEIIYASVNSANSGVLAKFNNRKTQPGQGESGTIAADQSWATSAGLWSQPLLDQLPPGSLSAPATANPDKKLYAVNVVDGVGTARAIDWLSRATEPMTPTFPVADLPYLLNGGNLALDQEGTLFVWNGEGSSRDLHGLYAFGASSAGLLAAAENAIPPQAQLFFGTDGTLYANDVSGRVLHAIVPQYTLDSAADADIYSPTHLAVTGLVAKSTTLAAGGGLFLGSGFRVQFTEGEGSTLRISTGVTAAPIRPVLQIDSDEKLTGISNITVNGSLYNVAFPDGSCIEVFNGCDDLSAFQFSNQDDALAAAQVILDAIENTVFDAEPGKMFPCPGSDSCIGIVPFGFTANNDVAAAGADSRSDSAYIPATDQRREIDYQNSYYAVFTPAE